jgi:hypothetical protein
VRQTIVANLHWLENAGLDKSMSGGRPDLILLNARCKECMSNLCVFWYGLHFP